MQYKQFLIDKSYVEKAYIAPVDRAWPAVRFSFHPCLPIERAKYNEEMAKLTKKAAIAEAFLAETLATRITEWSLEGADGNAIEITAENILKFRFYSLVIRMTDIVIYGTDFGDADPDATESEVKDMTRLQLLAGDDGDIAKARDAALTKN